MTRHRSAVTVGEIRELTREDLAVLSEKRAPARTKTFRDTHHSLARMVAMGMRRQDIIEQSGYSNQRIYTLSDDPAFQELVAQYRKVVDESFKEQMDIVHSGMVLARGKAIRMLNDRLEEAEELGETPPVRELLGILEITADRTGYGKRSTQMNVNVDFGSDLEKALRRKNQMKTVESIPPATEVTVATALPPPGLVGPPIKRRV